MGSISTLPPDVIRIRSVSVLPELVPLVYKDKLEPSVLKILACLIVCVPKSKPPPEPVAPAIAIFANPDVVDTVNWFVNDVPNIAGFVVPIPTLPPDVIRIRSEAAVPKAK